MCNLFSDSLTILIFASMPIFIVEKVCFVTQEVFLFENNFTNIF